ncbi:MAG: hypothetical protein V7651_05505 [Hyphomonas oceanitis]|uniref:hypothetical protein n=1 Tax=Hyphomonas oceanitis TaxID=81033 RepID=UPI003002E04A
MIGLDRPTGQFKIREFGHLYKICDMIGLVPIGCEFISDPDTANGVRPPEWHSFFLGDGFLGKDLQLRASQGSTWALNRDKMQAWDVLSRISIQTLICDARLREVHEVYYKALRARALKDDLQPKSYQDLWQNELILSLHSALFDFGTLRDYLCELSGVLADGSENTVTTANSAIKKFKSKEPGSIERWVRDIVVSEGPYSIRQTSLYRDLIVHNAPIGARGALGHWSLCEMEWSGRRIPKLEFLIPGDPSEILKFRNDSSIPPSKDELLLEKAGEWNQPGARDALNIMHNSYRTLFRFGLDLFDKLDIKGEMVVLTDDDVVPSSSI